MNLTDSAQFRILLFILAASFMPLTAPAKVTFTDPLARQTDKWTLSTAGTGPTITFAGGRMLQSYPANSTPDPANNISAVYTPNFFLVGDFDARVDYAIDHYDPVPGFSVSGLRVQLAFNMTSAERVGWENLGYDVYAANHYWNIVTVPTSDLSGTLRIVRQGGQVSSYFKSGNGWQLIQTSPLQTQDLGPVRVTLSSGFPGYAFPGVAMQAAFSNYQVTADNITGLKDEPRNPHLDTFTDPLSRQTAKWTPSVTGTGPSITFAGGRMLQSYPANSTPDPANFIGAVYTPNFLLEGNFDARVDYAIDHYDPVPGFPVSGLRVNMAFNMTSVERVGWENLGYDVYTANHYWNIVTVPTSDLSGTLRIVRQGGKVSSYFKSGNGWRLIQTSSLRTEDLGPVRVTLGSGFPGYAFPGVAMQAAFSNYRVTAEKIDWLHHEPHLSSLEALAASHMKKGISGAQTVPAPVAVENSEATSIVPTVKPATQAIVSAPQGLEIKLAPALSLTGDVGSNYRIEFTSAMGPTNDWSSLAVITLTNNPQIYFDASALGQPSRFYRVQKVP